MYVCKCVEGAVRLSREAKKTQKPVSLAQGWQKSLSTGGASSERLVCLEALLYATEVTLTSLVHRRARVCVSRCSSLSLSFSLLFTVFALCAIISNRLVLLHLVAIAACNFKHGFLLPNVYGYVIRTYFIYALFFARLLSLKIFRRS